MGPTESRPIKRLFFASVSLILTVGVLLYLFTHISLHEVMQLILNVSLPAVSAFVVLSLSGSFFRMWRYRLLLAANGRKPPALTLFLVVLVRNFCSDLLPARSGSLIYIFLLTTRLGVPIAPATSSFALSFLFDIVAILPMIAAAAALTSSQGLVNEKLLLLTAMVLGALTIALIVALPKLIDFAGQGLNKLILLPESFRGSAEKALASISREVKEACRAGIYGRLFVLSLLVRLAKYASLYTFLYALLAPQGYGLNDLPATKVFLGLCAAELAASLPVSGIAGLGAYQAGWVLTFQLLGFDPQMAKLTSISHHLCTQLYGYSLGLAALLVLLLPAFEREPTSIERPFERESTFAFAAKLALSLLVAGVLVVLAASLP